MLVGFLFDIDRRVRFFDHRCVQDFRRIGFHHHIGEVEFYLAACLNSSNCVSAVTVICHTIHRDEGQSTLAIEEVFNDDIINCLSTDIADGNSVVESISYVGLCFINRLRYLDFSFRNICFRFIAGNLNFNLIGGVLLFRFVRIFTRNVSGSDVLQDLGIDIRDQHCVGVMHHNALTGRDTIDQEFSILEGVPCSVNAFDDTSKVVGVGQTDILHIVILAIVDRDRVGDDLTGLGDGLIRVLVDGNDTIIRFYNFNRFRRDLVILTIVRILNGGLVYDRAFVFGLHGVSIHNFNHFTGFHRSDGPGTISIVGVLIGALGINVTNEVVVIGNQQIGYSFIGRVGDTNRVRYDLVDFSDMLIGFLFDIDRRVRFCDYRCVQDFRCIVFHYHIGEMEFYFAACLNSSDCVGPVTVICHTIHRDEGQSALATKIFGDYNILSISFATVGYCDSIVQSLTDLCLGLIYALCNRNVGNFGFDLITRNFNFNMVGRKFGVRINGFIRIDTVPRIVRVFRVCSRHFGKCIVIQNVRRNVTNLHRVGVGQHNRTAIRDSGNMEFTVFEGIIGAFNSCNLTHEVVVIGNYNIMDIKALVVGDGYLIRNDFTGFRNLLVSRLMDCHLSNFRNRNIHRVGRQFNIDSIFRVGDKGLIFQHRRIFITHRVGVVDVDRLTGSDCRDVPDIVANVGVLIAFHRSDITGEVVRVLHSDVVLGLSIGVINADGISHNVVDVCDGLICALFRFKRRTFRFRCTHHRVQNFRRILGNNLICEMQVDGGVCGQLLDGIGAITIDGNANRRDIVQRAMSIEEIFNTNIFQNAITNVGNRNSVVENVSDRGLCLIDRLRNLQFALRRINRSRHFAAGHLNGHFIGRDILFVFGNRLLICEPVMQSCNILQFVVRGGVLTGINSRNNVVILNLYALTSRNSTNIDLRRTGFSRFQLAANHIGDDAAEVVGIGQVRVDVINRIIVDEGNRVMNRITDLCDSLIGLLDDGRSLRFGCRLRRNRDQNFIGFEDNLAFVGGVGHVSLVDQRCIILIARSNGVGVNNVHTFIRIDGGNQPLTITHISDVFSVLGRDNGSYKIVGVIDQHIVENVLSGICDGNRIGYDFINVSNFLIRILDDFRQLRAFNSGVIDYIAVAFLNGVFNRDFEGLPCRNFCNRKGLGLGIIGVSVTRLSYDVTNTIVVISNDDIRYRQRTVILDVNGVVDRISNTHAGFGSGLDNRHITFRSFTDMNGFVVRVTRNRVIIRVAAFGNSSIDDVTICQSCVLRYDMIHIADFDGFTGIQARNDPLACAVVFVIAGIFNRAITVCGIGNHDGVQIRIAFIADGQRVGDGRISLAVIQLDKRTVCIFLDYQFVAQNNDIFGIRLFRNILVARDFGVGVLRCSRRCDVVDYIRVAIIDDIRILNGNALTNRQARNDKDLGLWVVGISFTRRHDEHANCVGIVLDGHILHVNRAIIGHDQLICDNFARISVFLIGFLDDSQVLIGKRNDNLIGLYRSLRDFGILTRRDNSRSGVFQLLVDQVIFHNSVAVGDRHRVAHTQRRNRPGTIFIYGITEMQLGVFNRSALEVVGIADNDIFQSDISCIGDLYRVRDYIANGGTGLIGRFFNRQVLTNDFYVNVRRLYQPVFVRITVFGNQRAIRGFRIAQNHIHISNLGVVDQDIVIVRTMIIRLYRVGIGEGYGIGMVFSAVMRQFGDDELTVLFVVGHIAGLRQNRQTQEVVGIFHHNIVEIVIRGVRNRYGVTNYIIVGSVFTICALLNGNLFLVINGQRSFNIFNGVVGVAAGTSKGIGDNRIAGDVRAMANFGLRSRNRNAIHHIVNAERFVIHKLRRIGVTRIGQRRAVVDLGSRIRGNDNRPRINIELTRSYGANLDVRYRIIRRNDRVGRSRGTDIFTRNAFRIQMHCALHIFLQLLGGLIRFIGFIDELIGDRELCGIIITVYLTIIFCLDIDDQRQDLQVTVNVDKIVIRVLEGGIFCGDVVIANRTPLFCIRLNDKGFLATDVVNRIAALIARDRDFRDRIVFAEILFVIKHRNNDSCRRDGQSTRRRDDFVVAGRIFTINRDGIFSDMLPFVRISTGAFNIDNEEIFISGINDFLRISDSPGQRIGIRFTINFRLVIGLDMDGLLANRQIATDINELIVAMLRDQSGLGVIDGIVADLRQIRNGVAESVVAIQCGRARNDGFVILDTGASHILNVTTDKAGHRIGEFRNIFTIGGTISTIDFYSNSGRNDLQRTVIHSHRVVRVRCVIASGNEVVAVIQRRSPLLHGHACGDIAAYDVFTSSTVQLDVQGTIFGINQTNDVTGIIFIVEGESRIGSAVSLGLVVNANDDSLGVDGDIAIDITNHIVLLVVAIGLYSQRRGRMLFAIFQHHAIRVDGIFVVRTSSDNILACIGQVIAQSSKANLAIQHVFLLIFALESSNLGREVRVIFTISLRVTTHHSNRQFGGSDGKVAFLNGDFVVLHTILAVRANVSGVDSISLAISVFTSPHILAFLTIDVSAFEIARLYGNFSAFLIGQHGAVQILNVEVAIFTTQTIVQRVGQCGIGIAIDFRLVVYNNSHRTRDNGQCAVDDRDLTFVIQRTGHTGNRDAVLIGARRRGLCIQMSEGNGVGIDTGFFRRDLNHFAVFGLIHMVGVFGGAVVEEVYTIAIIASLIINHDNETLPLHDQVVCVVILKVVVGVIQFQLSLVIRNEVLSLTFLLRGIYRIRTNFFAFGTDEVEHDGGIVRVNNNRRISDAAAFAQHLSAGNSIMGQCIGQSKFLNLISFAKLFLPANNINAHRTRVDFQNTGLVGSYIVVVPAIVILTRHQNTVIGKIGLVAVQIVGTNILQPGVVEVDPFIQCVLGVSQNITCGGNAGIGQSRIGGITMPQTHNIDCVIVGIFFTIVPFLITDVDNQGNRCDGEGCITGFNNVVVCRRFLIGDMDVVSIIANIFAGFTNCTDTEHFAGRLNDLTINGIAQSRFGSAVCLGAIKSFDIDQARMDLQHVGLINEFIVGDDLPLFIGLALDGQSAAISGVVIDRYRITIDGCMAVRVILTIVVMVMALEHFVVLLIAELTVRSIHICLVDDIAVCIGSGQVRQVGNTVFDRKRCFVCTISNFNDTTDGVSTNEVHIIVIGGGIAAKNSPAARIALVKLVTGSICTQHTESCMEVRVGCSVNLRAFLHRYQDLTRSDFNRTGIFGHDIVLQHIVVEFVQADIGYRVRTNISGLIRNNRVDEFASVLIAVLILQVETFIIGRVGLMIFDQTFQSHPAVRTLVPVVDIITIRKIVLTEPVTINNARGLDLHTNGVTVNTAAQILISNIVVIIVVVDEVHFIALLDVTDKSIQIVAFLHRVIKHDIEGFTGRNTVNEELSTILIGANTLSRHQCDRTVACKAALDHQVFDFLRCNIVALGFQTVTSIRVGNSDSNGQRITNLGRIGGVAILDRIGQMLDLIFSQTVITIRLSNTVISVGVKTGQGFACVAVGIRANIRISIQCDDIIVRDIVDVDVVLPFFANRGVVVGVIHLDVVGSHNVIRVVILLSLRVPSDIGGHLSTSQDSFIAIGDRHALSVISNGVSQIPVTTDVVGVPIIGPGILFGIMVQTVNIQRSRIDRTSEVLAADVVVVVRVIY